MVLDLADWERTYCSASACDAACLSPQEGAHARAWGDHFQEMVIAPRGLPLTARAEVRGPTLRRLQGVLGCLDPKLPARYEDAWLHLTRATAGRRILALELAGYLTPRLLRARPAAADPNDGR